MSSRMLAALTLAAALVGGVASPLPALAQDVPSYAAPAQQSQDETIQGRIESVDDAFHITVRDDRGFIDRVALHQGTIIVPRGLALAVGMSVTIVGVNAGTYFEANEIDTPYAYDGAAPPPAYYGDGYWYPGYAYGYGPAFCLGLGLIGGTILIVHEPFHGHPWRGIPGNGDGHQWRAQPGFNDGHQWRHPLDTSHPHQPGSANDMGSHDTGSHVTTAGPNSGAGQYRGTEPAHRTAVPDGPRLRMTQPAYRTVAPGAPATGTVPATRVVPPASRAGGAEAPASIAAPAYRGPVPVYRGDAPTGPMSAPAPAYRSVAPAAPMQAAPAYRPVVPAYSAPVHTYSAPAYSAPAYSAPAYSAPVHTYSAPAFSAPARSFSAPVAPMRAMPSQSGATGHH